MAGGAAIVVGSLLILFGLILAFGGTIFLPKAADNTFDSDVKSYATIDSTGAQNYDFWAGDSDRKSPYYFAFRMMNLTNPVEVFSQGATPVYREVGPYTWRRYRTSVNVSFPDNGNQLKYSNLREFYYQPDVSGPGLSPNDIIYNVNPVFIAAGVQAAAVPNPAGGARGSNLLSAAGCAFVTPIVRWFTTSFVSLYSQYAFSIYFNNVTNFNEEAISLVSPTANAEQVFAQILFNATTAPTNYPTADFTALLVNANSSSPVTFSMSSALALLDATKKYSLADNSADGAYAWDQAVSVIDRTYANLIASTFNLTNTQVMALAQWRARAFIPTVVHRALLQQYSFTDIADLGWFQFVQFGLLQNEAAGPSVINLWPQIPMFSDLNAANGQFPEFAVAQPTNPDWRSYKANFTTGPVVASRLSCQAYLQETHAETSITVWIGIAGPAGLVTPALRTNLGSFYGLIINKTVNEWTFHCNDYLVTLLRDAPYPNCAFQFNDTAWPPTTVHSGKDDISKVNQYIDWRGSPVVQNIWAGPLQVSGYTDLGQFAPGLKKNGALNVFDVNFVRTARLDYNGEGSIKGISTYKYAVNFTDLFTPDPFFFQNTTGFANVSSVQNGSPIFLSAWDMANVSFAIRNKTQGMNMSVNLNDINTQIEVEPKTGNTVFADKRVQINLQVPSGFKALFQGVFKTDDGNSVAVNIPDDIYYPVAKVAEQTIISDSLAHELIDKLDLAPKLKNISFFVGITVGPVLIVIGGILLVIGLRSRNMHRKHYHQISE